MNIIKDLIIDEERGLYNQTNIEIHNVKFDGPKDGESALKECTNIIVNNSYFNLRYPLWHVNKCELNNVEMTPNCRAALWYCNDVVINDSNLNGIKALRECISVSINNTNIDSFEFGWKSSNIKMNKTNIKGEYLFLDSDIIFLYKVNLKGKYSFQYVNNLHIENSKLDTKDAFWHASDVIVINSKLKGEYLGWYSKNLTLINCEIQGTQPLCYCENLRLIDCTMKDCDLSFENSEVNGNVLGYVESIKNPLKGTIIVDELGALINDDVKYNCVGEVLIINKN